MKIIDYSNYKLFTLKFIENKPKKGRGLLRSLSEYMGVNSSLLSQIFKGNRDLTPEQALQVAKFIELDNFETQFFLNMVHLGRAGTQDLKSFYQAELEKMRIEQFNIQSRVVEHRELNQEEKALFYSDWKYSGIRLLTSIPNYNNVERVSEYFGIQRDQAKKIIDFLVSSGLCVDEKGGLSIGVASTHISKDSEFVNNHRRNWRLKALQVIDEKKEGLHYSSPVSLSHVDYKNISERMVDWISEFSKTISTSKEEKVACLNIDWFEF